MSTSRRQILGGALALGCSAAASPLLTPMTFASVPGDNRLVVIVLRGALDGLDAIQPISDRNWTTLRPSLAGEPDKMTDAGGGFALHPALTPLAPLWGRGEFGVIHAVSTPYRDRRSHFDGQDLLEAGLPDMATGLRDGWLNRFIATLPGAGSETAFAVGRERMLILDGTAPVSSWAPGTQMALSPQAARLLETLHHQDPIFRDALAQALVIAGESEATDAAGRRSDHLHLARFAAERLRRETRIASFSMNGWDTHANQGNALALALGRLSDVILALRDELGPVWERTAVLCITEFGRTVRENGSRGTDHGTGGAMLFAGGAMRGGRVVTDWPGLGESDLYAGRDLMPTRDLRAHAAWVLAGLFGTAASTIADQVFPRLDVGSDPGLLL